MASMESNALSLSLLLSFFRSILLPPLPLSHSFIFLQVEFGQACKNVLFHSLSHTHKLSLSFSRFPSILSSLFVQSSSMSFLPELFSLFPFLFTFPFLLFTHHSIHTFFLSLPSFLSLSLPSFLSLSFTLLFLSSTLLSFSLLLYVRGCFEAAA